MAHELAHTRQADTRDVKLKEAEALATEAAFLDWLNPGGAPLVKEDPRTVDPTRPDAAAAGDFAASGGKGMRASVNRQIEKSAGPRKETARTEGRVSQVLERVLELLDQMGDAEGQRLGRVARRTLGRF